ncbi:MAG: adenosylcobinamide-GDP ribazoletransferase [Oscillospiraceae bacterium]|nr:adenosylcobinamide-GDP ribazoletransferase [Oscillospiraceae bacterium]
MKLWNSILIAFSMFSAIPTPQTDWNERSMRFSLCAFPLVGVVVALCCRGWWQLCSLLALPAVLRGAGLCVLPVLITGGIHLDGYADTCDALASHTEPERRQEILKDPHLGAFAAIRLGVYFVLSFALWTAMEKANVVALLGLFGLSRSLSGLALLCFPLRKGSGLARRFAEAADQRPVRGILILQAVLFGALLCLGRAPIALAAALLVFLHYRQVCVKAFDGLSGDLAGWFLQRAELWMLGALVIGQYVEVLF